MEYKNLLEKVPENEIVSIEMDDGTPIKCKKIPFDVINMMEDIFPGIKDAVRFTGANMQSVANLAGKPLFYAVGDVSKYVKKDGVYLSSTRGANGKFDGQPGFANAGIKAGFAAGKFIPYVGIAIAVIEIGFNIVKRQKQIKAEKIEVYKNYQKELKEHINNLLVIADEYTISIADNPTRAANIAVINNAFLFANNTFAHMNDDANANKIIDEQIVYTMKMALNLYSFAKLLKIMFAKVEDINYINSSLNDILEKTDTFNMIFDKCYKQYTEKREKRDKNYKATQFKNNSARIALDVATGGLSELVNLGSKTEQKNLETSINNLNNCKQVDNPYIECIERVSNIVEQKHLVLFDEECLYYQVS